MTEQQPTRQIVPPRKLRWSNVFAALFCILLGLFVLFLLVPTVGSGPVSKRGMCRFNLTIVGIALSQYHEAYGCFPPPFIADKQGRPMHSWRVLLLPYLGQKPLYDMYDFNEPWDGPNNIRLLDSMPSDFACAASGKKTGFTNYVAVVGDNTVWNPKQTRKIADIKDGAKDTVLLVEVADSDCRWTEPRDLDFNAMNFQINADQHGPSSHHKNCINALMCGGSNVWSDGHDLPTGRVIILNNDVTPDGFRALLTIDAKDAIPDLGPQ